MDRELQRKIEEGESRRTPMGGRDFGVEEFEPFYSKVPRGKFRSDPAAIKNFDELARPKAPPSRVPREPSLDEKIAEEFSKIDTLREVLACDHPECTYCAPLDEEGRLP